jgi:hypothetical protein
MPGVHLLLLLLLLLPVATADVNATATITVDTASLGQRFWGVGGVSAGGSSRLLFDYPEPARSGVLDALFTPGKGFGFQARSPSSPSHDAQLAPLSAPGTLGTSFSVS